VPGGVSRQRGRQSPRAREELVLVDGDGRLQSLCAASAISDRRSESHNARPRSTPIQPGLSPPPLGLTATHSTSRKVDASRTVSRVPSSFILGSMGKHRLPSFLPLSFEKSKAPSQFEPRMTKIGRAPMLPIYSPTLSVRDSFLLINPPLPTTLTSSSTQLYPFPFILLSSQFYRLFTRSSGRTRHHFTYRSIKLQRQLLATKPRLTIFVPLNLFLRRGDSNSDDGFATFLYVDHGRREATGDALLLHYGALVWYLSDNLRRRGDPTAEGCSLDRFIALLCCHSSVGPRIAP
jgi:hypothetical protein